MSSHSSGPSGPLEPGRAHFRKAGHGEIVSYIEHNGQRFKVTFTPPEDTADKRYIHLPDAAKKIQAIAQSILQKASRPETLKTHIYQADILFQESKEEITGADIDVSKKDKSKSDAKYEKMELEAEHVREITTHAMELITFVNPRHMTRLGSPAASPRSSARTSRRSSLSTAESGAHAAGGLGLGGAARSRRGSDASTGSSRSTSRRSSLSEGPRGGGAADETGGSRLRSEAFHRRGGSGSVASSRRDSFAAEEASLLGSALGASGARAHAAGGGGEEHAVEIPKVKRSSIETEEYEGKVYYKSDLDDARDSYQAACEAVGGGSIGETEQAFVTRTLETNELQFPMMAQDPVFLSLCPPVILNAQHNCFLNAELISLLNNNETCSYLIGALDSLKSNASNPTIEGTDTEQKNLDYINSLNIKEDYKEIFCQLTIGQAAVNADNISQKYLGGDDLDEIESQLLRMCLIKLFNKKPREMSGSLKLPHVDEGCEMQLSWANQEDPSEFLRLLQEGLTSLEIDPPNPEILQISYLEDDQIQTDRYNKIQLTREFTEKLEGSETGTIVLNYEGDKIWALNKIEGYEISSLVVKQGGSHYISVLTINDQDNVPHFIVYDDYKEPPKYEISSLEYFELICGLDHYRKIKSVTLLKSEEEIPPMPKRPPPAPPKYPPLPRSPEGSQASSRRGSDASAEE